MCLPIDSLEEPLATFRRGTYKNVDMLVAPPYTGAPFSWPAVHAVNAAIIANHTPLRRQS
jgi:hypothetical protein